MATEKRYQNGVVIIEPHGKIVGHKVAELRAALLPEVKAFDHPGSSSTSSIPMA